MFHFPACMSVKSSAPSWLCIQRSGDSDSGCDFDYKSVADCSNFNLAGISTHLTDVIVNNALMDLDERDISPIAQQKLHPETMKKTSHKKRKHASTSNSLEEQPDRDVFEVEMSPNMASLSVKIAALEALEALLSVVCLILLTMNFLQIVVLREEL